ncbi:MAG: hypothetical protein VW268_10055 [Rhodospirillaceae bacterium]
MKVITAPLAFLGRHATTMMALGVFVGLLLPHIMVHLQPYLSYMVWLLMVISMVQIKWADAAGQVRRPVLLISIIVWMLAVTPVLMWLLVEDIGLSPGLVVALVLTAATCPLMSTPAVGMILGLDATLLLLALIAETFLVPLSLPVVSATLVSTPVETFGLMQRLALLVFSTAAAAAVAQKIFGSARIDGAREILYGSSVLLLVLFAASLMSGVPDAYAKDPDHVLFVTGLSFAAFAGLQALGAGAFWGWGWVLGRGWTRTQVLSAAFVSGNRNLAVLIAVLLPAIDPDTMLYFMVGQFPIYLMPSVWRWLVKRLLPA